MSQWGHAGSTTRHVVAIANTILAGSAVNTLIVSHQIAIGRRCGKFLQGYISTAFKFSKLYCFSEILFHVGNILKSCMSEVIKVYCLCLACTLKYKYNTRHFYSAAYTYSDQLWCMCMVYSCIAWKQILNSNFRQQLQGVIFNPRLTWL